MSHKTIYLILSKEKVANDTSAEHITALADEIMSNYLEETATEENAKLDYYVIGGRWAGTFGAPKGTEAVFPVDENIFAYQFTDNYNAIANNGNNGPYLVDGVEYIPINGGLKKDIDRFFINRFESYTTYMLLQLFYSRDPRFGNLPPEYEIADGCLYINYGENRIIAYKDGESFTEYMERLDLAVAKSYLPPDAYIDTNGIWHDDNEIWNLMMQKMLSGDPESMSENPMGDAEMKFFEMFDNYIDSLSDDDYILVLDGHSFP